MHGLVGRRVGDKDRGDRREDHHGGGDRGVGRELLERAALLEAVDDGRLLDHGRHDVDGGLVLEFVGVEGLLVHYRPFWLAGSRNVWLYTA